MRTTILAGILLASAATPALAQSDNEGDNGDSITIGAGVASTPRYEGADDNTLVPAGAIRGSISGIGFTTVGPALYVDLVPREGQTGGKFVLGPLVHATLNRTSNKQVRDPQIIALGKRDIAVELGGQIGFSQNGVITSDYDNLSINLAGYHDVTGTHDSYVLVPSVSYGTPLSQSVYVGANASASYVGRGYAQTYFGINNAQGLASGLPEYTADEGFKDVTFGLLGNLALSGDLRSGLSVFAIGSYSKLLGDFKRSPVTRDPDQWFGGVGLAYTF